ncbi:hypothetical protein R7O12_14415 [Vibrio sp. Vb1574]|uniref:hypothetical protein n=1 Tax=Vibrio sp. Vb1574 TaxID=3074643 RepID=UPI00142811A6|nr:hypothetical protein [Vibrio sp. Vb1574]MDW1890408.1 hypothetical protein [Vibrio sp. Vb1574]QIR88860.1 hypothetical protein FQ332_09465 [Vibrio diabolicus]
MKIDEFINDQKIEEITDAEITEPGESCVSFNCAVVGHTKDILRIEYQGTVYDMKKQDVIDVASASEGVVTASALGSPSKVTLRPDATLQSVSRIQASDLIAKRPFVLERPSQSLGISFARPLDEAEEMWLRNRGLLATETANTSSSSTLWSDSTSPSTSQPRLDNWVSDDSQSDGQHPDD